MGVFLRARKGEAADRIAGERPLEFREGPGAWLDERAARRLQRLLESCRTDLRLATGAYPAAGDARAILRLTPPGVRGGARVALGLDDARGALAAALVAHGDFPRNGCWHVSLLLVRPDHRGRGIATGLLGRLERMAERRGADAIHAVLPTRIPGAIHLFRRAGFEPREDVLLPVADRSLRASVVVRTLMSAQRARP